MEEKFKCSFCKEEFPSMIKLRGHQDAQHDIILLPIMKEELVKLVRYLQISQIAGDISINKGSLVSPELYRRMQKLMLKTR